MRRITLLFLILVLLITKSYAQIEKDKALHFLGGNLYGLVGAGLASQISKGNRAWTFVGSVGGSFLIGLAKEAIDENQYNGWDNADLLATVLGGASVGVTIDVFKKRKKRKRDEIFRNAIGLENNIPPFDLSVLENKVPLTVLGMSTRVRSTIP
ncbi:hypothetical protein [Maribacter antarcticus]|uniref:hypothetical protein n=1 Tax=Maribacter antarcticus TaxID=505250 RepID=UPI000ADB35D1|nr:hypothetical protein [Maribacter antarcticus]